MVVRMPTVSLEPMRGAVGTDLRMGSRTSPVVLGHPLEDLRRR